MPSDEEMRSLLTRVPDFWDPAKNPKARFVHPARRVFQRLRAQTMLTVLVDSACRIGEVVSFRTEDWEPEALRLTVRESKGREPRAIPVSPDAAPALNDWLKQRLKLMRNAPVGEDEGWLFVSETGTQVCINDFRQGIKAYARWLGLTDSITLHSIRRFSLNKMAKKNIFGAQQIAGHKDTKTTMMYTKLDPDFVRAVHTDTGVLAGVLQSKREKKKRLV